MKNLNGLTLLRLALALIFLSHGVSRIYKDGVFPFGKLFLDPIGFAPFGIHIAWTVTIFELVGSVWLIWGKYRQLIACLFILHQMAGIALVHFKEGWFVVGSGRNGQFSPDLRTPGRGLSL